MDFLIAKLLAPFVNPVHWLVPVLAAIALIVLLKPALIWPRRLLAVCCGLLLLMCIVPVGPYAMQTLENRIPMPSEFGQIDGIIVLGGPQEVRITELRKQPTFMGSSERLFGMLHLQKIYPDVPIIVSGGSGRIRSSSLTEAGVTRQLYSYIGVVDGHLLYEEKSRNTWENAKFSKDLIGADKVTGKRWLLVTSAFHMPRAVAMFRAHGWNVVPYPVGYRTPPETAQIEWEFNLTRNVSPLSVAMKEYIGLLTYYFAGKIEELWPSA